MSRISRRVGAITESATLAVDAKAKALQAAGEDVIGFGAGEPDFPTPAAHRRRPRSPRAPTRGTTSTRPRRGPARAARGHRREDRARLRLRGRGRARCSSPTAASTPSTTRSRRCSTPATRSSSPRRTGPPIPRRSKLADGVPVEVLPTTSRPGSGSRSSSSRRRGTPRTKALLFVSPSNPTGAVYPPDEVEAIGRWAVEHGIWVVTDEIYEHLTYGDHEFTSMPVVVPELAEHVRRAQRRGQDLRDDRVARRLDDRSRRLHQGRGQPAVAPDVERRRRERSAPRSRRWRATSTRSREMRAAFDRRGQLMHELLVAIPGVTCLEPQGAFYCFPSFEGVLGRDVAGRTPTDTLELCEVIARGGQGRDRPRRGVRRARVRAAVVRPRRRRPGRGRASASPSCSTADRQSVRLG